MGRLSSEERKKEIIDASLEIIFEEGMAKLTMRNIASKIGVSEAALYKHFENKQEVVENLIDFYFTDRLFNEQIHPEKDFRKAIYEIFDRKFSWLEGTPKLSVLIFQEEMFREFPNVREKFVTHRRTLENQIYELIKYNQNRGTVKEIIDPHVFAMIITGSIRLSILRWSEENYSYPLKEEAHKLAKEFEKILAT